MDGKTGFFLVGTAIQILVGMIVLRVRGGGALRAFLATLFFLNAIAALAASISPTPIGRAIQVIADDTTGAALVAVGFALLRPGRGAAITGSALIGFAATAFTLTVALDGSESRLLFPLADAVTMTGFAAVVLGAARVLARGDTERFSTALFLALAIRPLEFLVIVVRSLDEVAAGTAASPLFLVWRVPFVVCAGGAIGYLVLLHPRSRATLFAAIAMGTLAALTPGNNFAAAFITLFFSRSLLLLVALSVSGPGSLLYIPRDSLLPRSLGAMVGTSAALVLVFLIERAGPGSNRVSAFLMLSGLLLGYATGGIVAPSRDDRAGSTPSAEAAAILPLLRARPPPYGERLLLALRGVRFEAGRLAPAEAGTKRISEVTGIPPKRIPEVVRRMNGGRVKEVDRRGPALVAVDLGPVIGTQRARAPRYRLTAEGETEAERVARALGIESVPREVVREAMGVGLDGPVYGQEPVGVGGERHDS